MAKTTNTTAASVAPLPDTEIAPATVADAIAQNAIDGIASASGDGQSVTKMSVRDQIAADEYASRRAASRRRGLPIRHIKLIPPGAADVG